jgi:hypothetical protein
MKYICKKSSNQEMIKSRNVCYFAVVMQPYNANFKFDQSVLAIHDNLLYYEISEDDHPSLVTHARDH